MSFLSPHLLPRQICPTPTEIDPLSIFYMNEEGDAVYPYCVGMSLEDAMWLLYKVQGLSFETDFDTLIGYNTTEEDPCECSIWAGLSSSGNLNISDQIENNDSEYSTLTSVMCGAGIYRAFWASDTIYSPPTPDCSGDIITRQARVGIQIDVNDYPVYIFNEKYYIPLVLGCVNIDFASAFSSANRSRIIVGQCTLNLGNQYGSAYDVDLYTNLRGDAPSYACHTQSANLLLTANLFRENS